MRIEARTERSVAEALRRSVAAHPDKPFLVSEAGTLTYAGLDQRAERLAAGLLAFGVSAGEHVLLMLPNTAEFITLWIALAKIGAVEVPINTAYRGTVLAHVIDDSEARVLVIGGEFLERLADVEADLHHLERLVVYREAPGARGVPTRFERHDFERLDIAPSAPAPCPNGYGDLLAVMYTSGTTGVSKGVMITEAHAYEYSVCVTEVLDIGPEDVYYAPLPLFHIAGQWAVVYAALLGSATVVLKPRFSVSEFWGDVARYRVNTSLLLGAMANFLYRQPAAPEDSATPLDKVLMVPPIREVEAFARRFGVRVTTNYGSTEVGVPVRAGFEEPRPRLFELHDAKSCGRAVTDRFEVRIVDEHDEELPPGAVGELVVRPKHPWIVMAGYWKRPEQTAAAWRNLWLHSGDAMYRDEAGNYYFVDRLVDAIRRRGENISSVEVENEINAHPAVLECAVFPVPAEVSEDEVMAVVVLKEGETLEPAELAAYLEARTAAFMVPRYIELADALPKTQTGKIQKFALRERAVTERTWDRERGRR